MDFLQGIAGNIDVDITIGGGAQGGISEKKETVQTVVIEKTTTIENVKQSDFEAYKVEFERMKEETGKMKKENGNLRTQLVQLQKVLGNQTKELNSLKQARATELKSSVSMTIQTTTVSQTSAESKKLKELQFQLDSFIEENKRDDAQIAQQKITIEQQQVTINSLQNTIEENTTNYTKQIAVLNDKYSKLEAQLKLSEGDDASDKTKLFNLQKEIENLNAQLKEANAKAAAATADMETYKASFDETNQKNAAYDSRIEELNIKITSFENTIADKEKDFEDYKRHTKEDEEERAKLIIEIEHLKKLVKDYKSEIETLQDRVKKVTQTSESYLLKKTEAEEKFRKGEIRVKEVEAKYGEMARGFEVLRTKISTIEPLNGKLQLRIVELEDELKKMKEKLDRELAQDIEEQKQINDLTNSLNSKMKVIEELKKGGASDNVKIETLTTEIRTWTTQMTEWKKKAEEENKEIEEKDAIIEKQGGIITALKGFVAELKAELDKAHSMSMAFKIDRVEKEQSIEKTKESVQVSAEYKKLEIEAEGFRKSIELKEVKINELIEENKKIVEELAQAKADLEKALKQASIFEIQLKSEQSEKISFKAQKEELTIKASKSVEKEQSFFKSAEEHVSTYRDDINATYNSIHTIFAKIEEQLV